MSPNEFQLRAALQHGEGDRPDPDAVIARGMEIRYQRRRRRTAVAAAAIVVAFVGGGTGLLIGLNTGQETGGAANADVRDGVAHGNDGGSVPSAGPNAHGSSAATNAGSGRAAFGPAEYACPQDSPQLALPGGGGIGQFGSKQPLFARSVASMTICVYSAGVVKLADSGTLTGAAAGTLARALENGSTSITTACTRTPIVQQNLALYAVDSAGSRERVVTVQLSCPYLATNGTAVRYLSDQFIRSLPASGVSIGGGTMASRAPSPPGRVVGTPVK